MTYRKHGYIFGIFYFKQCDITGISKADQEFPKKRISPSSLAATEREDLQEFYCLANGRMCAFCRGQILLSQLEFELPTQPPPSITAAQAGPATSV